MKIKTLLFGAVFFFLAPSFAAEKVAWVIGNSKYKNSTFPTLKNPHWDAKKMRDTLQKLGFKVHFSENLGFNLSCVILHLKSLI